MLIPLDTPVLDPVEVTLRWFITKFLFERMIMYPAPVASLRMQLFEHSPETFLYLRDFRLETACLSMKADERDENGELVRDENGKVKQKVVYSPGPQTVKFTIIPTAEALAFMQVWFSILIPVDSSERPKQAILQLADGRKLEVIGLCPVNSEYLEASHLAEAI